MQNPIIRRMQGMRTLRSLTTLATLALLIAPLAAPAAPDTPAIMLLTGQVVTGDSPNSTTPRAGDQVLAFSASDARLAGSSQVGAGGDYALTIGRTASFNGTMLVLELLQGNRRYSLSMAGSPAALAFHGRTLPERTRLDLQVGTISAELPPEEAANPQAQRLARTAELPCTPDADANGDGKCDDRDWAIMRLYGGGVARSVGYP